MATSTSMRQRIGIWVIAIALTAGTIMGFVAMILSSQDQQTSQAAMQKYQAEYSEYQKKVEAQGKELSGKYYETFKQYADKVGAFDAAAVTELASEDIVVGEGEEVNDTTKFAAYYIGWNPSGKVFDQSIKDSALAPPIAVADGLKKAGLIEGWKEGMKGMKIGGVRMLTIPAAKAYGDKAQGADIPANTPLRFVVMAIPQPAKIDRPVMTPEVMKAYQAQMQGGAQ